MGTKKFRLVDRLAAINMESGSLMRQFKLWAKFSPQRTQGYAKVQSLVLSPLLQDVVVLMRAFPDGDAPRTIPPQTNVFQLAVWFGFFQQGLLRIGVILVELVA